jgi:hypothetical protein
VERCLACEADRSGIPKGRGGETKKRVWVVRVRTGGDPFGLASEATLHKTDERQLVPTGQRSRRKSFRSRL